MHTVYCSSFDNARYLRTFPTSVNTAYGRIVVTSFQQPSGTQKRARRRRYKGDVFDAIPMSFRQIVPTECRARQEKGIFYCIREYYIIIVIQTPRR